MNVAPGQESLAALLIEIAFARSAFALPLTPPLLAGTAQPAPEFVCGEVTVTLPDVLQPLWPASTVTAPSEIELTWTLYGFGLLMVAATSADAIGYRLELGVPAEIVIEVAEPAEACPEPLPPVVHAATATPMTDPATTRTATMVKRFLFLARKIRTLKPS